MLRFYHRGMAAFDASRALIQDFRARVQERMLHWLIAFFCLLGNPHPGAAAEASFERANAFFTGVRGGAMAWGDYDNDGYLDVILTGHTLSTRDRAITALYHNNGNGTFTRQAFDFVPYRSASVAWGDFDNDGFLDLAVMGLLGDKQNPPNTSRIYRNLGGTNFIEAMSFGPNYDGSIALGDFDNDGWLDMAISGTGSYNQVYRNQSGTNLVLVDSSLDLVYYGSVNWADFDQDGNLDLLLSGMSFAGGGESYVYRGDGLGGLDLSWSLRFASEPARIIDLENDGWPDLVLQNWYYQNTYLYHNDGLGGFANAAALPIGPLEIADFNNDGWSDLLINNQVIQRSSTGEWKIVNTALPDLDLSPLLNHAVCGDYDNDGKLDLIISTSDYKTSLYRNTTGATNMPPTAPTGLSVEATATEVVMHWQASTDGQQAGGLTYNLRVGTYPGGGNILSPMSAPNGFRRVVRPGNTGTLAWHKLKGLESGKKYYWSVQAVDNAYAGSPFSEENTFVASDPALDFTAGPVSREIDHQTGLFYQSVTVTNTGLNPVYGLRFSATQLPPGTQFISATGTNQAAGIPMAEMFLNLAPGATQACTLAYYSAQRQPPLGVVVTVEPIPYAKPEEQAGAIMGIRLSRGRPDGLVSVEFDTIKDRRYAIEYSDNLSQWKRARPAVRAPGTRMVWVDTGPPATDAPPFGNRFYRVVLLP